MATSGKGTGIVGYNVQTAVDAEHHLIVAHEVTNQGNDRGHLVPMALKAQQATGNKPRSCRTCQSTNGSPDRYTRQTRHVVHCRITRYSTASVDSSGSVMVARTAGIGAKASAGDTEREWRLATPIRPIPCASHKSHLGITSGRSPVEQ